MVAIIAAVLIVAGIYFAGVRYMRVNVTDSLYVKFLGQVDDNGQPYKGRIIYSDGISAEVNLDREEISYSNGDVYCGPLDNLLKNGEGEMRYANGDTYKGQFKNDLIDGYGTYTYVGGDSYVGEFTAGLKNGDGTYTFSDGSVYIGSFKNDKKRRLRRV